MRIARARPFRPVVKSGWRSYYPVVGAAARVGRSSPNRVPLALACAGACAGSVAVVAGGRGGAAAATTPPSTWFGLLPSTGNAAARSASGGLLFFLGVAALVVLWLVALGRDARWTERQLWWVAAAWAAPFVAGPPLISKDVFSYAAQGLMVRSGLDPYSSGVSALATVPTDAAARSLASVDPVWRSAPSPYGPVATAIEHTAISVGGGSPLGAVVLLRALAVLCVIAIGLLAMQLAGERRNQALVLTLLNPLVLIHLVSGAHFEAPMGALLLGALVAAKRDHWTWALLLACAAGSIKAPAYLAVLGIGAAHTAIQPGSRRRLVVAARDAGLAAAGLAACTLLVDNGLGWINGLKTPAQGYTPSAPASLVGDLLSPIVTAASFDDLAAGARVSCLLLAGCTVLYLTVTAGERPLHQTVGCGLVAIALLGPTIYPWYLLWGTLCLAGSARGRHRDWLVLACGVLSVTSITGAPGAMTTAFDVIAVAAGAVLMWRRPRWLEHTPRPADASVPAVLGQFEVDAS